MINFRLSPLHLQIVYILDQVRALESEMLRRIKQQGLDITPRILIVSVKICFFGEKGYRDYFFYFVFFSK